MDFFYNLNKKLAEMAQPKEQINEGKESVAEMDMAHADIYMEKATSDYSAKKARAGKDIGKPGKMFGKIAADAAERYGSKERGEKVAGAVLKKLRAKEGIEEVDTGEYDARKSVPSSKEKNDEVFRKHRERIKNLDKDKKAQGVAEEADMDEGNEFSGALAKAKAAGAKEFEVDGKTYPVKEAAKPDFLDLDKDGNRKESMKKAAADKKKNAFDPETAKKMFSPEKGKTKTGHEVKDTGYSKRYTKKLDDEPEMDDNDSNEPKKKGRKAVGAGKGKKIGAKHSGTSKLHRKAAIAEDDMIPLVDKGEYDREGDMAKEQLHTIEMAADELASILSDNENLPEWVQSKITKAMDYIDTARDYMKSAKADRDEEMVPERKLSSSEKEEREDIVKGMKKNKAEFKKRYGKRGEEVMYATATKLAKERGPGNPDRKKEESVKETDTPKKAKGGVEFGKGIYESMNSRVENMIAEGMNISVNVSQDASGQPTKNITVSADGDDAEALAQLLNLAGLQGHAEACSTCGSTPCGCEQQVDEVDENQPDYPTDQEIIGTDDPHLRRYAGGVNGPKSTGQTVGAPFNRQDSRQGPMKEDKDLGLNLYKELQSFKAK